MKSFAILTFALLCGAQSHARCIVYLNESFITSFKDAKDLRPPTSRERFYNNEEKKDFSLTYTSLEPTDFFGWESFPEADYKYTYGIEVKNGKKIKFTKTLNQKIVSELEANSELYLKTTDYEVGSLPGKRMLHLDVSCNRI